MKKTDVIQINILIYKNNNKIKSMQFMFELSFVSPMNMSSSQTFQ